MAILVTPDVCKRVELLCRSHSQRTVAELTGVARSTIWALKKRGWQPSLTTKHYRPRPSDFAIQQRHMNREELAKHYRTSNSILARWSRELRG